MSHSSSSSTSDEGRGRRSPKKRKAKKDKKGCNKKRRDKRSAPKRLDQDYLRAQVDQEEVERLLLSLLQLSPHLEAELLKVFKQLDSWGIVYLQDLGDLRLRKKLRHLFRALLIGEVEGERGKGWRKVPAFKSSLAKFVKRCCKEVRPRVGASSLPPENQASAATAIEGEQQAGELSFIFDAGEAERKADEAVQRWREQQAVLEGSLPEARLPPEAPGHRPVSPEEAPAREQWMLEAPAYLRCLAAKDGPEAKRRQILQQKQKDDEESVRVKAVMEEWNKARKLKSLREMREEGEFAEGEEAYKRWKRTMDAARSVWGKRATEQAAEQEFQEDAKKGQPWQRFDRDRDLQTTEQVSQAAYQKLVRCISE